MMRIARATTAVLQKAGVEFGILGEAENCCGESIRKTGDEELFKRLARENIKAFIDHGVKRILVNSPHCYHTFKNEYPEFRVDFEVVHISELLLELIDGGKLTLLALQAQIGNPDAAGDVADLLLRIPQRPVLLIALALGGAQGLVQ